MNSPRISYLFSIFVSVILHTVLLVAITYGWDASQSRPKKVTPRYVEAKLVQLKPQKQQKAASPPKVKKIDLTKQRQALERKRAEEQQRRQRQEQAQKEKQRQEQLRKEQERKEQERKEKERKERQRQEQEKARQAEAERQRELEQERQQMEERFEQELAKEESRIQEQEYATTAQSFVALIASRIESNWSRPPSARKGMECELSLRLVPTGQVIDVSITKSSGNSAFDRSALQAVKKIERFPELQNVPPAVFERYFRVVQLVFSPEDLRQ